jgi:lantibiotic modifying enzyme
MQSSIKLFKENSTKDSSLPIGPTFCYGLAGYLQTVTQMWKDTSELHFLDLSKKLEQSIKSFFNPNHSFGFQARLIDNSEDKKLITLDHPGLLHGASGVAMTLLQSIDKSDFHFA